MLSYRMSGRASSAEHSHARLPAGRQGLAERRRLRRRRILVASGVLFFIFCGALVYGLWQEPMRIKQVTIYGADQSLASIATATMQGTYLGLIPRDSAIFFSRSRIRSAIISAHPDIAAISIFRTGLTGLSIRISDRVPIARWCGGSFDDSRNGLATTSAEPGRMPSCYLFDANGFVYATSSETQPVNAFAVYLPLASTNDPLGATLPGAARFPATFAFARELASFGSPVAQVALRDGEVDDYLASGTRVTYLLGDEQNAFTALTSARANLDFSDGSLEYIDLRFPGKVYLKKASTTTP